MKERTVRLSGNKQQIEAAKYMIRDVINQVIINSRTNYFGWRDICANQNILQYNIFGK